MFNKDLACQSCDLIRVLKLYSNGDQIRAAVNKFQKNIISLQQEVLGHLEIDSHKMLVYNPKTSIINIVAVPSSCQLSLVPNAPFYRVTRGTETAFTRPDWVKCLWRKAHAQMPKMAHPQFSRNHSYLSQTGLSEISIQALR